MTEAMKVLDEIEAALALIVNATEAAFESGALFTYEEGAPRPEWANTVTSPFYFGPGILPKVSKAFFLLPTLRAALAPPADGAGEVEEIRQRHDSMQRTKEISIGFFTDDAFDDAHADRATLLRALDAMVEENARLAGLIRVLLENEPHDAVSDGGHTVFDLWRHDARAALKEID